MTREDFERIAMTFTTTLTTLTKQVVTLATHVNNANNGDQTSSYKRLVRGT